MRVKPASILVIVVMTVMTGLLYFYPEQVCQFKADFNNSTEAELNNFGQAATHLRLNETPKSRITNVQNICHQMKDLGNVPIAIPKASLRFMMVDDRHQFIFCLIPKVANTNWKRIELMTMGKFKSRSRAMTATHVKVHELFLKYGKTLQHYNHNETEYRIKHYKKIMFVRDPLERLLSAFRDKFWGLQGYWRKKFGPEILKHNMKVYSNRTVNKRITFLQFIRYITSWDTFESSYDIHWARYTDLCQPCLINYDFIGKFETMKQDVDYALRYMGISDVTKFPQREISYKRPKTSSTIAKYYKNIPGFYIKKCLDLYRSDYRLFSYTIPQKFFRYKKSDYANEK